MLKVNVHGIQGDAARCIRNWSPGRRKQVCINQSYRNWLPVTSGVPQRNVLAKCQQNIVSKMSKFDDTKFYTELETLIK